MADHETSAVRGGVDAAPVGRIISVSGSMAKVLLNDSVSANGANHEFVPTVGSVLTVDTGSSLALCLVAAMSVPLTSLESETRELRLIEVEFAGELMRESDGYLRTFRRGVSILPRLGDELHVAQPEILQKAYQYGKFDAVPVGVVHQNPSIPAVIKTEEMLSKHFAVVGSTGTGKSCTVTLLLQRVLARHPNAHVVLLDPHNEYAECFRGNSEVITMDDLGLPFWVMNFEEIAEIIIGDTKKYSKEVEILRDMIPLAKQRAGSGTDIPHTMILHKKVSSNAKFAVDTPIPYRITEVLTLIEEQMGRLEMKNELGPYKRLKARIESVSQDPRFHFMFGKSTIQDSLPEIIRRLFRIPVAGKPITVLQLMGIPSEVLNVLVSVLARLTFDVALWSEGKIPITLVCEEAHRYVPRNTDSGFEPTKRAISRIAKEGRKYGASLCIVSQRPGDIDPTILSQCSTIFTMRLTNESDQKIIETALSDASRSLLNCLSMLGTRETIVFGEGAPLSSRILLDMLPENATPARNQARFANAWSKDVDDPELLNRMIKRWRRTAAALGDTQQLSDPDNDDQAYQAEIAEYSHARIYSKQPAPVRRIEPAQERPGSQSFGKSRFGG